MVATSKLQDAEEDPSSSRIQLLCVMFVFLATPAVILGIEGYLKTDKCSDERVACHAACDEIFAGLEVEFIGTNVREMACHEDCNSDHAGCESEASILYVGTAMLLIGLFGGCGLVAILEAIGNRHEAGTVLPPPRAAYAEPIYSETELRAQKSKYAPVPKLVETRCLNCKIMVEVEEAWKHGSKGGMRPAYCPRCRQVVVGMM
mmetsp:Transcript_31272/g.57239  ORF Transcript_31272/g.57239 Transcript_31272/m.57239 type:complete len:204 (+) Transcript_31272:65-676(+)